MNRNLICKRMTALLLAVLLFASCCMVNAAGVYTKQELEEFEENVRLLSAFGLLDKGREAATTITRGDFSSVMLKYLGYDEGAVAAQGGVFSDVADPTDPAYGMAQFRLMQGYPDGSFRPEENLLTEQAVKVLVNALGYYYKAESMGGYPVGYISCGREIGLLRGTEIQQETPLTYITLVQMMVNALTVKLMETDGAGSYFARNNTWLNTRLNAQKSDGVLTAVGELAFEGSTEGRKNTITVDGKVYYTQEDYSGLLGDYVRLYANAEDEIIYLTQQRTTRQTFDAEVLNGYADKTYMVDAANGKQKKYRLAQDNQIFYNGASAYNISAEEMCPVYGSVTLVDNNRDGIYEVVHINSYQICFVKGIDTSKMIVYYQNDNGEVLDFSEFGEDDLTVVNAAGDTMKFDQILTDSVIRVAIAKDNQKAKIIVSVASVMGTVTALQSNGGMDEVTIDGTSYQLTRELSKSKKVNIGTGGTFYLDCENIIAAVSEDASGYSYGYLDGAQLGMFDALKVRIFDSTGQLLVLDGAEKIEIDGLERQNGKQVYDLLKKDTGSVVKTVVRFKRNGKGELSELDTPYNSAADIEAQPQNGEDPNSLRLIYSGSRTYYAQTSNFAGKLNVDTNSILFSITGDNAKADYHALRKSDIPDKTNIQLDAYSDSKDEFYAKILFSTDRSLSGGTGGAYMYGVVSDVAQGLDEDGMPVPIIHFMDELGERDLILEEELAYPFPYKATNKPIYPIEAGDILALQYDGTNATNVTMLYKHSEDLFPGSNPYQTLGAHYHYVYGPVYSVGNGFVNVTTKDLAQGGKPTVAETESYRAASFKKIYKCTSVRGKMQVTLATESEIADYLTAGDNCSKAVLALVWEYPKIMVIY